jgi:hypothetical protein
MDKERINKTSSSVRAWALTVNNAVAAQKYGFLTGLDLTEYYCDRNTYRMFRTISYNPDLSVKLDSTTPPSAESEVVPESLAENELDFACGIENRRRPPTHIGETSIPALAAAPP